MLALGLSLPSSRASGREFNPATIPNLQLWLKANEGATTDGTTPASNGDLVTQWNDQSGNGNHVAGASDVAPTFKTNILNGRPVLRFGGLTTLTAVRNFFDSSYDTAFTIFIVDTTALGVIYVLSTNSSFYLAHKTTTDYTASNLTPDQAAMVLIAPVSEVAGFRYDGALGSLIVNNLKLSQAMTGNLGLENPLYVGSLTNFGSGFCFDGDIAEILIFNRSLTDLEMMNANNYLMGKYGLPTLKALPMIQFVGDSITAGVGTNPGQDYPTDTVNALGGATLFEQLANGINNATAAYMLSQSSFTTDIDSNYNKDTHGNKVLPYSVLVCMIGTNDCNGGAFTVAEIQTNIQTYCAARRSAGYKVVVTTVLPRNTGDGTAPGSFESNRQLVNTWLRANFTSFADALSDVGSDPLMGQYGDAASTTYYADGTHPNDAGAVIVASYSAAAIQSIIP